MHHNNCAMHSNVQIKIKKLKWLFTHSSLDISLQKYIKNVQMYTIYVLTS